MTRRKKVLIIIAAIIVVAAAAAFIFRDQLPRLAFQPTDSVVPESSMKADDPKISTIATNLETPWAIAFLPDGDMLVTERTGTVARIDDTRTYQIDGVVETSEGGLLGIALHPAFNDNKLVYLYSTYEQDETLLNRVERYTYDNDRLTLDRIIIDGIPGAHNHDGGALAFGPDGKLYVTTGDAGNPSAAQDINSLSGKILRLNDDGSIPADNPFENAVYSYGHRNPQGVTWDDRGRMWATEHGPSGASSGWDELNLIEAGVNYGWPVITGDETRDGMRQPVVHSGDTDTWAPGGIAYVNGALFFSGLRGQALYEATLDDNTPVSLQRHFVGEFGRLRAVAARDDYLYVSTSNTDGRGSPRDDDDKILRIEMSLLTR